MGDKHLNGLLSVELDVGACKVCKAERAITRAMHTMPVKSATENGELPASGAFSRRLDDCRDNVIHGRHLHLPSLTPFPVRSIGGLKW